MANIIESFVTEFLLEENFTTKGSAVQSATRRMASGIDDASDAAREYADALNGISGPMARFQTAQRNMTAAMVSGDKGKIFDAMFDLRGAHSALERAQSELFPKVVTFRDRMRNYLTKMDGVGTADGAFGGLLGKVRAVTGPLAMGGAVIAGAATGLGFLGWNAMQAAASFDTLERTFGGALGSMEAGKQMMKALDQYAMKSAFGLDALARASAQLAAGGLDVGRFLPVIERFALVISGTDPAGLEQVASAMIKARGGGFGEAMESLRRAGIGAPELRSQGIDVNKGGEIMTSPEKFFQAIEQISQGRMKSMADEIAGGDQTKMSNLGDAMAKAFREIGEALNARFGPAIEAMTDHILLLIDSGVIESITNSFVGLFAGLSGGGGFEGAIRNASIWLMTIPKAIGTLWGSITSLITWIYEHTPIGAIQKFFDDVSGVVAPGRENFSETLSRWMFGHTGGVKKSLADSYGYTESAIEYDSAVEAAKARQKKTKPIEFPKVPESKASPVETAIERNTRATAEATRQIAEVQNRVMGGGATGQQFLNPVYLRRHVQGNGGGDRLMQAVKLIRESVMDELLGRELAVIRGGG